MKATHILDWKTANLPGDQVRTLCGREALRSFGGRFRYLLANDPHAATCKSCRAKRDPR